MPVAFLTAYYGLIDLAELRAGRAGPGPRRRRRRRHGRGPARPPPGGRGVRHRQPGQVACRCAHSGLDDDHIASSRDLGFEDALPRGHRRRGHGRRPQRPRRRVRRRLARPAAARRPVHRDGQGRHPRPGDRGRGPPRRRVPRLRPARRRTRTGPARCCAELVGLFAAGALPLRRSRAWDVRAGRGRVPASCARPATSARSSSPSRPRSTRRVRSWSPAAPARSAGWSPATSSPGTAYGTWLLASRRGPDADGAAELGAELDGLGCRVHGRGLRRRRPRRAGRAARPSRPAAADRGHPRRRGPRRRRRRSAHPGAARRG